MWIMASFGLISVVQKPGTSHLTIRARVRVDLDRLRRSYLPSLSPTAHTPGNDYCYRATASHEAFAQALARAARDIRYANFKSHASKCQGAARAAVYSSVWAVLQRLETPADRRVPPRRRGGRKSSRPGVNAERRGTGLSQGSEASGTTE
jgi:hypothetical protein